ncbi:MAG TPA: FAD/NAD(P)-binding oxidoreductase [Ktedonobacteraceae bacterium]|nr:FAD/NAD(P)-binding oxidoreductase [Ktedonobacteraceae bacterium]
MNNRIAPIGGRQFTQSAEYADIVIVGNGIAGLTAAIEARRLAPHMSIVMITDQCHPTIHTPALKQFAIGKMEQEQLLAYPAGTERMQRIHVVNARVEGINAQGKYLHLQGGYGFGYGSLLIATGSKANGLPSNFPGRDFDGVLTLHRLQDYLNLRRRLPEVDSAVVIGGGAHAIETVMALLHHGIEVHWLIRGATFLSKVLDGPASELVLEHTRHAGAKIYTNTQAVGVVGRLGSAIGVVTSQNEMIPCQMVLVCTGTSPDTTLADHCSIPMLHQQGILVDEQLRTNVRDIYAVGDVAALKNPQTGVYETHAQWYAAVRQGGIVAAAMTGQYDRLRHAMGVPWHATNVGELYMLTVGTPLVPLKGATPLTDRGKKRYRRMSIIGDRLVGYLSLGSVQPDSLAIKRIIDEGLSISSVKKALLKGNFDARKFFSQRQSRSMQEMVTSGKLPAIVPNQYVAPLFPVQPLPVMPPTAMQFSQQPIRLAQHPGTVLPVLPTSPTVQQSVPVRVVRAEQATIHQLEEIVPLLPVKREPQTGPRRNTRPLFASIYHQATIHVWDDAQRPTTDALPPPVKNGKKVIESILVPLPARPVTRNLWTYSEKIPAAQVRKTDSLETEKVGEPKGESKRPINFLL